MAMMQSLRLSRALTIRQSSSTSHIHTRSIVTSIAQSSAHGTHDLATDSFQLSSEDQKSGPLEDNLYNGEVESIQKWWTSPRFEKIKRPYSAHDVASKRGTLNQSYPSSLMAQKLFNLLNARAAAGLPVHTSMFLLHCSTTQECALTVSAQWVPSIRFK